MMATSESALRSALSAGGATTGEDDVERRAENALFAVAKARTQLARLIDYAVVHCKGLTDESPLAVSTFLAIKDLDEAFPRATDMGTGRPLNTLTAISPTTEDAIEAAAQRAAEAVGYSWDGKDAKRAIAHHFYWREVATAILGTPK